MSDKPLPKRLQPALKALEKDLLDRAKLPAVEAGLRAAWDAEKGAGETGQGFDPWRRARVTQIAVAWILSVVFVRTLEDRGFVDPRIAGADAARLAAARDREVAFSQIALNLGPREYLLAVFRELAHLPGAREVFDARHNPVWVLAPSSEGARALLDVFQQPDAATGAPVFTFPGADTRFLGDLYQDLSEAVRKRYALLQTPEFVEEFILDQTLDPAVAEFGLAEVRLLDPTCGSGHFLLGGFRRLLAAWQRKEPTTPVEELARRALAQVHGVDINPYAVAIARFRLVLAVLDAVGVTRLDRAPALRPKVVVADSLLHRLQGQQRLSQQVSMTEWASWGDALFRLTDPGEVAEVLGQRYHAITGNPPYVTEKDPTKKEVYRSSYVAATNECPLAPPFLERFFELAVTAGFVGAIVSNAFAKRDSGKALVERVLSSRDMHEIVDTAGCYIPGHGTPTVLLFGRNRPPTDANVVAILGKRGEQVVPADPASAPVWSEIVANHQTMGFEGSHVSVESASRDEMRAHPWIIAGGGARPMFRRLSGISRTRLADMAKTMGAGAVTRADDVFLLGPGVQRLSVEHTCRYVTGTHVRDWSIDTPLRILFPYTRSGTAAETSIQPHRSVLYSHRTSLWLRRGKGFKTKRESGGRYYEYSMYYPDRHLADFRITYASVATHNHFVLSRGGAVFNRHAPIIILSSEFTERDYQALVGYLNSSTVGFWCRLVMFPKGGDQVGDGARLSASQWNRHLEYAGNLLQQLPVPSLDRLRDTLLDLVIAAEDTVRQMGDLAPEKTVAATLAATPTLAALREARTRTLAERARLRGVLVSLQEEMDWRVYGLFGLPTVTAPSVADVRVPVEPNHRPFEVRLARDVATDVSASEWFRLHKRAPPADVGGPLADLYRERLRLLDHPEHGRQLRLLETPETKRRWSPPDDAKAFRDAVRAWVLERVEAYFREQPAPELRTARQLALDLGQDAAVQAAHELLTEESGHDLGRLLADLVDAEGVPFLAGYRYTETGMEKRAAWEETWRLQRVEDATPEAERSRLPPIPIPDKYANKDFQRHFWGLRGKLDVPKERFVTVPGGNTDDDPTPLVGWAGWDHLQVTEALARLYRQRKDVDGWPAARVVPLLAGIAERVPWLLQWHDEPNARGQRLGQSYERFLAREAHTLGVAVDALRTWTPPAAPKRKTLDLDEVYAALLRWTPEVDEDAEDEEAVPPEGPTADELASEVGATKALVGKALKKLEADGRIEKLDGRPARYVAIGDDA